MKTEFCNPINIEYKFQHYGKFAHREAADPTLIYFKDKYYLFPSMSAGFYYSDDLANWSWHENRDVDMYRYAPDVRQIGDFMYFCASSRKLSRIWRTQDPLSDQFELISEPFDFWDPDMFYDEKSGKTYLYWGCGNAPLYGVEMDTKTMQKIGKPIKIMEGTPEYHGFERRNVEHVDMPEKIGFLMKYVEPMANPKGKPYIEGAYLNKFNGTYYFQYAAPGTEMPTYGDGVYVSNNPLKGFKYQAHNPYSFVPTGFMTGAGHGSTIEDRHGNLWHISTMRISINASFERRLGLWPAGIDEDGNLFCNQNFATYPIIIPEGKFDPKEIYPHYMLLSYKKQAAASSCMEGHGTELGVNECIRDWWCAKGSTGEWYQIDLGKVYQCHSIQLNLAEEGIPSQQKNHKKSERSEDISSNHRWVDSGHDLHTRYVMEGSIDGKTWFVIEDKSKAETDLSHDYIVLPKGTKVRYVKVTAVELAYNQNFAISGLRVFGLDENGKKPAQVSNVKIDRSGELDAHLTWDAVPGAMGYNIRFGIAPDKLYNNYQIYDSNEVYITALNKGQKYFYAVDSYNEAGITVGNIVNP